MKERLVGYVRGRDGFITVAIDKEMFSKVKPYQSSDGREFVRLKANMDKVKEIIEKEREVTSLCSIEED